MVQNNVVLKRAPYDVPVKEQDAAEALDPGHILETVFNSGNREIQKCATQDKEGFKVALETWEDGASGSYASGDQVRYIAAGDGFEVLAQVEALDDAGANNAISAGDTLYKDETGVLRKDAAQGEAAVALEDLAAGEAGLMKVEVLG